MNLVSHIMLFSALMIRFVMVLKFPCIRDNPNNTLVCPNEYLSTRETLDSIGTCMFAFAANLSLGRLSWWLQLHDRFGPIVINVSRVVLDVSTMFILYLLFVLSFSSAFFYITSSEVYAPEVMALNTTPPVNYTDDQTLYYEYSLGFSDLAAMLFWSILNPGPSPELDSETVQGLVVAVMYASFQIVACIIFLNLLIATMNSTVQRVESQKELYWKFTRSSIWMEFFDVTSMLPPPFNLLVVFWIIFYSLYFGWKRIKALIRDVLRRGKTSDGDNHSCKHDSSSYTQRIEQARLLIKLVNRFLESGDAECVKRSRRDDGVSKDDLEKLRRDIVEEIVGMISEERR